MAAAATSPLSSDSLAGRVALVTGSAIGLGAAIATRLASLGARLVLTGYPTDRGEALAARLPHDAVFIPADLRHADETRALAERTLERCGGLDILVNNAADSERASIDQVTPELFDRQFHIIVRAPLLLTQAALPSLTSRKGVIINIGSVNAHIGWPDLVVYAAAKAALVTASKNLANALKYARVRVHCLNPGWIDTEGERAMSARLGFPAEYLDQQGATFPIGRILRPEEVAEVVAFFASPAAASFSGTVIELEQFPLGGMHPPQATEAKP